MKKIAPFILLSVIIWSCIASGDSKIDSGTTTTKSGETSTTIKGGGGDSSNLEDYNALFNHDNLNFIDIVITRAEWDGMVQDMLEYKSRYNNMRTGKYRKATMVYRGKAGDVTVDEIAIRTRGNTTRVLPENPKSSGNFYRSHFAVKFNKTFELTEGTAQYDERKDRRFCNLRGLNFKYQEIGDREGDPSMFRELYSYDLLNRIGVYAPKSGIAVLYVKIKESDGKITTKNYGVYTIIEPVDKSFLTRRYGKDQNDGDLYKCLWQQNGAATLSGNISGQCGVENWETNYRPSIDKCENEDVKDFSTIKNFVSGMNSTGLSYLETNFEIDRFLRWLAGNMLLGMPDDYWSMGNNYYLYFNNKTGKCEFIPYDYDHGLGGGWDGSVGYDAIKNADIEKWFYTAGGSRSNRPLVDKILSNSTYMAKYKGYLADFINPDKKLFNYDDYLARFNKVKTMVSPYLSNTVYGGGVTNLTMTNEDYVKTYFDGKISSVNSQLGNSTTTTTNGGTNTTTSTTITTTTTTTTINLGYTSPEITADSVIFRYKYTGTDTLVVRGSFNNWDYNSALANWKMIDIDGDQIYELTKSRSEVPLKSEYKFYYGSTWTHDPANPNNEAGDGKGNSIVVY